MLPAYEVGNELELLKAANFTERPTFNQSGLIAQSDFTYEVTASATIIRRADGLIYQYFKANYLAGHGSVGTVVTLPIAFPNQFFFVMCSDGYNGSHAVSAVPNTLATAKIWGKVGDVYTDSSLQIVAVGR